MNNRFLRKQHLILLFIGALVPQLTLCSKAAFEKAAEYLTAGNNKEFIKVINQNKKELLKKHETTTDGWDLTHLAILNQNLEAFNQLVRMGYFTKYRKEKLPSSSLKGFIIVAGTNEAEADDFVVVDEPKEEQITLAEFVQKIFAKFPKSPALGIITDYLNGKLTAAELNEKTTEYKAVRP